MPAPMRPSPMNPTFMSVTSFLGSGADPAFAERPLGVVVTIDPCLRRRLGRDGLRIARALEHLDVTDAGVAVPRVCRVRALPVKGPAVVDAPRRRALLRAPHDQRAAGARDEDPSPSPSSS